MAIEVLVFEVEGRKYCVPAADVVEVVRAPTLSPLPQESEVVEGLLNLRGRVLPVIDIRRVFQLTLRPIKHTDHLVVVQRSGRAAALRVDQALDLIPLQYEDRPARQKPEPKDSLLSAVGRSKDGMIHVLNISQLLSNGDLILSLTEQSLTEVSR